jgi:hypothetical protein
MIIQKNPNGNNRTLLLTWIGLIKGGLSIHFDKTHGYYNLTLLSFSPESSIDSVERAFKFNKSEYELVKEGFLRYNDEYFKSFVFNIKK